MNPVPVIGSIVLLFASCAAPLQDHTTPSPAEPKRAGGLDTAQSYATAIADYIRTIRERDGSFPDTVFIGRHDDFPGIELPPVIEHTSIRTVAPAEVEAFQSSEHFAYLNVFGWFAGNKMEFFVVKFKQGMSHWPDGRDDRHLYYSIGAGQQEFALDSLRF